MHNSSSNKSNEYGKAQALFARLKNDDEVVATDLLHAYLKEQGMSEEWASRALDHIDVNHDNELTWAEFATKGIRIIDQLRLHEETVLKPRREAKLRGESEFRVSAPSDLGETTVAATEILVSAQPLGGGAMAVDITETTVAQLPNQDILVEQTETVGVVDLDQERIKEAERTLERAKEAERAAAAAAFFEETKAKVIREAKLAQEIKIAAELKELEKEIKEEQKEKKFELGEQPEWAGTDACVPQAATFISSVISDGVASLNKRGYAIVELAPEVVDNYTDFHSAFEAFSQNTLEHKKLYATQQFDEKQHSPNQFHGFSVVEGLKEQFMMRLCGKGTLLTTPGGYIVGNYSSTEDMGKIGMKLYEQLDQLCRKVAHEAAKKLGIPTSKVDHLLDPVHQIGKPVLRDTDHPDVCYSSYVPEGFVSSSIMDNFHYYNTFDKPVEEEANGGERFYNNHSAHTDSGLLTVVVTTDEPGLEVFDQQSKQWVALEHHLHEHVKTGTKSHRQFATIFWADSVAYLKNPALQPCLHRVGKSKKERYSVVFKQRTSTLTTPPRYQEDYILADIQKKAMQGKGFPLFHPLVLGSLGMAIALAVGAYIGRPRLL